MIPSQIVTPSFQVPSLLPGYITETYQEFVKFMGFADASEERVGFSQDLLQNLQQYRDFNTYKEKIVEFGILNENITADAEELTLNDGYGFPDENGILYIDQEVILYTKKEGNTFTGLQRGSCGTVVLKTFRSSGQFVDTTPAPHTKSTPVKNLSVLFLSAFLETIYNSYAPNISPSRVSPEINNATFLENIKDFFQSKGSKLGIKALFKILFAENDVDVSYPGDRMIIPSTSTWSEALILRSTPQPRNLVDPFLNYVLPTEVMNSVVTLRSYNDERVYARTICDYVTSYPYEDSIQYELYLKKDNNTDDFIANPVTRLTRALGDENSITVESTLGFPDSGILFIGNEGITYQSKTWNQFLGCKRGVKGYSIPHSIGDKVFGPYYIKAEIEIDGVTKTSISYPLGLVNDINVVSGGLLHTKEDDVFVNGPGRIDPREPALASFVENYDEQLVTQAEIEPTMTNVSFYTAGVDGVFFDADYVFVSSSGFPYYTIGRFSDNGSIGSNLQANPSVWVIPRNKKLNPDISSKGTDEIGISVDGVPIYSDTSAVDIIQGHIKDFIIANRGTGYVSPTVLIDPPLSSAEATVENGQIVSIQQVSVADYNATPSVRITSGEGATFELNFDAYGRIISVAISEGGAFYKDVPALGVVDDSGRGKGAVLTCTVESGQVSSVNVSNSGIDYNPLTTKIVVTPIGSGAEVTAQVETYNLNRYQGVINDPNATLDSGNGFVWGDNKEPPIVLDTFGYVCNPTQLRAQLGDDGSQHSPILGWAFDGNPIYGPYGYSNAKNDSGGIERQRSGYVLRPNRNGMGSNPPAVGPYDPIVGTFPMGSFTQDFEYQPVTVSEIRIATQAGIDITTQDGDLLETDTGSVSQNVLDPNNGRICNTPEYPEDLYPDGIYAYFVTVDEDDALPVFPYYVGRTFNNRPLSQIKSLDATVGVDVLSSTAYSPSSFDETEVSFDLDRVERYRNPYLNESKDDISLKIADVTEGGISSIIVENGLPTTTKIGDILYYPDPETGGNGAEGVVEFVTGQSITSARGSLVQTFLRSHRQLIDLSDFKGSRSFVFVTGTLIYQTSGAIGRVVNWDTSTYFLTVQVETYYLFKYSLPAEDGDPFILYDNRGEPIQIKEKPDTLYTGPAGQNLLGASRPSRMLFAEGVPRVGIGGNDVEPGDLAWSIGNGRLYVYYDDGDTAQWVESQPLGTTPIGETASDTGVGTTASFTPEVLNTGENNTVTISAGAPSERSDGTPNRMGDLWWSQQTGILYIWYVDLNSTSQWVITEPTGTVPGVGAVDELYPELPSAVDRGNIYSTDFFVTISNTAPSTRTNGDAIVVGDLWWSSANGKMYIYYEDTPGTATNTIQWVQCNPIGSVTSQYGEDEPINPVPGPPTPPGPVPPGPTPPGPGPDPYPGGDLAILPEPVDQKLLWFNDMTNFLPGDIVKFQLGLPGQSVLTEVSKIEAVGIPFNSNGEFIRGFNDQALVLPNSTLMVNDTRAIFSVDTAAPHDLVPGDLVKFENSSFDEINGVHEVARAGKIIPGQITVTVDTALGQITDLQIASRGYYYTEDFFITFSGGGGTGAFGYAFVSPIELGGRIQTVALLAPGFNYRSTPEAILGDELTETQFEIYTTSLYDDDNSSLIYSAAGEAIENTAAYITTTSGGVGYKAIPPASGLIKREADRAKLRVTAVVDDIEGIEGQRIEKIEVLSGGARYVNPTVIIGDRAGTGSGASAVAVVSNGVVTNINVTSGGRGYSEPVVTLVEEDGKFISLTRDIGRITAGTIINPGRDISVDRSLRPELQITTRCIIRYVDSVRGGFVTGSRVYQGTADYKLVTATVVSYDDKIQQLTLERVEGILRPNELLKDDYGTTALVLLEGEADVRAQVSGTSEPEGTFITDESMLSREFAVIQDSKKYQWFSYEIASPIHRDEYFNFVNDIIHPTGFIMYSTVELNNSVESPTIPLDVSFGPRPIDPDNILDVEVLVINGYDDISGLGAQGYGTTIVLTTD